MRTIWIILGCGILLNNAAGNDATDENPLQQRAESFTIALNGSVGQVTPLFGPVREAEWAPTWKPQFVHPRKGAQRDGAVFRTVGANGQLRLWMLTDYDEKGGRVEYVILAPGFTVNEIKVRVVPDSLHQSKATITYFHSALAPAGNEEVAKLDSRWAEQQRVHWENAINAALAKAGAHE